MVEPKITPQSSPESHTFFETDQYCLKPGYLYLFNSSCVRAVSNWNTLLSAVNFSRISEEIYLEVKMLKEELAIDEEVKKQN